MDASLIASVAAATLVAGTPLVIAATGELVAERSGVLNLGVEGMMAVGAICAFIAHQASGSATLAVLAGLAAGCAMALVFGYLTLTLLANQVASGLALAIFGIGLAAFVGKPYESASMAMVAPLRIPVLADIPVLGPALFNQQLLVYGSWALVGAVAWFLFRSRPGLVLRAVGESPDSAHAVGYPVIAIRYLTVVFGGAMAGVAGAFLAVCYTPLWSEGMVAGRGWIALALVVFATWRPLRVVLGAYLFGGVMISQLFVQGAGLKFELPAQLLSSLPYLATVVVLVLISRNAATIRLNSPVSLGRPFRAES
jgi:ABC-type uncharacterized transport system permease subunit